MTSGGRFNSDQLRMYMNKGVPLSQATQAGKRFEEDPQGSDNQRKNLVLPKMLPEVFSMSFYNSTKKRTK